MADVRYSAGGESVLGSGLGQGYDLPGIKAKGVADVGRDEWGAAKEPLSFGAEEGRAGGEAGGSRLGPGRPGGGDGGGGSLSGRPGGRDPGDPAHLGSGAERAPGRSGLADGGGLVPAPGKGRGPRPGLLRRNPAEPGGGLQDGGAPGAALGAGAGPPAAGKGRLCPRFPGPGHDFARLRDAGRPGGGTVEAPGRGLREGGGPGGRDRLRLCEVWDPGRAELPGFAAEERGGDAWYLPEGGGGPSFVDRGFYVDCLGDSDGELSASLRLAQDKWGGVAPCGPPAFLARCWKLARLGGVNLWLAPGPPFFPPRGLEPALGNEGALLFVFGSLADALVSAEGAGSKPALCGGPDFAGAFAAIGGYLGGAGPGATAAVLFGPGPGGTGGAGAAFGCLFDMGSDAGLSAALRLGAGTGRSVSLRGPDEFLLRGWRLARERGVPLAETPELGIALGRAPSGARPTGLERRSPALAPGRFGRPREFAPVPGPFPARSSPYPPAAPEQVPAPRTAAPRRQLRPRDPAPAPGPYHDPDPGPGPGPGFRGPGGGPGM
ncbi:MAG: hypothetical protein LBQ12_02390 [Deltaproteobacteria bacterium]|nr:hypothetical protein [Deltaproteobacteria bacterium]